MALTNAFREAVTEKNVRKIRIMLKDSLLVDPSFKRFQEMERAASLVEGLYDVHDGRELTEDKEAWNDAYMDRLMVQVVSNFSHERIEHLKEVVRHQRPVPQRIAQEPQDDRSTKTSERFADGRNIKSEIKCREIIGEPKSSKEFRSEVWVEVWAEAWSELVHIFLLQG